MSMMVLYNASGVVEYDKKKTRACFLVHQYKWNMTTAV